MSANPAGPKKTGSNREFRVFFKKLLRARGHSYEDAARKLGRPEDLVKRGAKQIDHLLNDPNDGDPRTSLIKALERAYDVYLDPEDYGFDPEVL